MSHNKFWLGFLCGVLATLISGIFFPRFCNADYGVSLYSSYYSSAHMVGIIGDYNDDYDLEFGGYLTGDDAPLRTGRTAFLVQGNLKSKLRKNIDLLYGLSAEFFSNGEIKGVKYSGIGYGPYIGIEHRLDDNLRLRAIYHLLYITSLDIGGIKTTTTDFGVNGAFGLTYVF